MKWLESFVTKLINQVSKEVYWLAKAGITQLINSNGQQIEKLAPKIMKGAIEDVYKTQFGFLGNFGAQKKLHKLRENSERC